MFRRDYEVPVFPHEFREKALGVMCVHCNQASLLCDAGYFFQGRMGIRDMLNNIPECHNAEKRIRELCLGYSSCFDIKPALSAFSGCEVRDFHSPYFPISFLCYGKKHTVGRSDIQKPAREISWQRFFNFCEVYLKCAAHCLFVAIIIGISESLGRSREVIWGIKTF